jgi:hypothetical protein
MNSNHLNCTLWASSLLVAALALAACAEVKPIAFEQADEIKRGPGLQSGEAGEFVLLRGWPEAPKGSKPESPKSSK